MSLRPASEADFPAIYELFRVSRERTWGEAETEEELRQWLTSPRLVLERDVRLAWEGDRLVGYADVDPVGDPVRWWCSTRTHPDADDARVVAELVDWIEERVGEGLVRLWAPASLASSLAAFEAKGYRRIRASYRMQIELDGEVEQPVWPAGTEVRVLAPGEEQVAYDVHQETFADSWEHVEEPYDEWAHYLIRTESFDPSLWFLAWAGDEPAGVALCRVRDGGGFVDILGVRRPWRRAGLGRALLLHAFAEFRRRGLTRAALGVDAESLTGANRLYESAGMRVSRQLEIYEKRLG